MHPRAERTDRGVARTRRLADLLHERRDVLLQLWETAVQEGGPAQPLAVLEHVRQFLGALEEFVGAPSDGREALSDERIRIHAIKRLDLDSTLTEVVGEYSILRRCIVQMLAEEHVPPVLSSELLRLHQAIDLAIALSVSRREQADTERHGRLGAELDRERARAEEALEVNADASRLERPERGLSEALDVSERMAGVLAHDLRNPLGVISASASLLQREGLEPRQARIVGRIANNAERIERMIHDLLDYTRAQTGGRIPTQPRPTDLGETCRLVAEESELLSPGRFVEVKVDGDARGQWDPDRAYQAISNLVANALRYGAEDRPVRISVRGGEHEVIVRVHNAGTAIAADQLSRIFEPFQRGTSASTARSGGLGLGLYIVRQIALAHGGSAEVASDDVLGTTFSMRWPRKR